MAQTKRNEEKVVVTKIYFYGSAKIEQKIKVCLMENKGSVAKMIKVRGNNSMLTSKLHFLSNILAHVDGFSRDLYKRILLMR